MNRTSSFSRRIQIGTGSDQNRFGLFLRTIRPVVLLIILFAAGTAGAECAAPLENPGGAWDSDKVWRDVSQALDFESEALFVSASYRKSETLREFKILCYRLDNISRVYDLLNEAGVDQPGYENWEDNKIAYTPNIVVSDDGSAGRIIHIGRTASSPGGSVTTLTGHQGLFNETTNTLSDWTALDFQEPEGCTAVSLAQGAVGGQSQASVMAADGQGGLSRWDFSPRMSFGGPIIKDKLWFFGPWKVRDKISHAYDDCGRVSALGATADGALVYTTWDENNNPIAGGWLTATGAQTWDRLGIGFGPDGRMWASAHNITRNRFHIFEKAAGDENFNQSVIIDPTGYGLGYGASMSVDSVTGRAYFTYGHDKGLTKTLYKDPGTAPVASELSPTFGQAEFSATSAYNDRVYRFWLTRMIDERRKAWLINCPGN